MKMRILHMFNWKLNDIKKVLEHVAKQGFDAIQINPIQPLKEDGIVPWYLSYQPCGFRIGNQYGSKEDLISLCNAAKKYNITIIADVICEHMAGKNDGTLFPHEKVDDILTQNPYFWKLPKLIYNWHDRYEVINYSMGLPSLNLCNYDLQDIIVNFLNELIDCGIGGFRFDAAKNIALPNENCDFWWRTLSRLKTNDLFNYAEIIFSDSFLIDEYAKYINVLTDSRPNNKNNVVAFCESHDTFLEFGYTKDKSDYQINDEYIELARSYPNTIYYTRPYNDAWKNELVKSANNENYYHQNKIKIKVS